MTENAGCGWGEIRCGVLRSISVLPENSAAAGTPRASSVLPENQPRAAPRLPKMAKKSGWPGTGRDPVVPLRLPRSMLGGIDTVAAGRGIPRGAAIRVLVGLGLPVEKRMELVADPKNGRTYQRRDTE